ncbi:hypothetical protein BTR23_05950 [Alkalihalophilus pseudofirmus]|nr:hypothetical protein BTR23_05950 [Alkalihalophilus pseudofirmus]
MSGWVNENKKQILYSVLIFFLALAAFYLYLVRPLQAEEISQEEELQRIQTDITYYETQINKLSPQTLTRLEIKNLLDRVPMRPNVEQVIADLERTELETGVVINNVSFSIHPNESQEQTWKHILSDDLYTLLETQVADVDALSVSYIEMNVNINGEEEDVHTFIEEIEKLKRIVHVQSYNYSIDNENDRLQGSVTLRAFYSENFAEFIEVVEDFKLDYDFDPSKLNRYIEVASEIGDSTETSSDQPTEPTSSTGNGQTSTSAELKPINQSQRYIQPNLTDVNSVDQAFYVVQTGGYNTETSLYEQITKLRNAGIYPREIERDKNQNESSETKFVIYTGVSHDRASAERLASYVSSLNPDFTSWVDRISYQNQGLSSLGQAAHDVVVEVTDVVTKGMAQESYQLSSEQLELISAKIRVYELKAKEEITKSSDTTSKYQLEDTLVQIKQVENTLKQYQSQNNRSLLWQSQGALLDFMLTLNGYVSLTEK